MTPPQSALGFIVAVGASALTGFLVAVLTRKLFSRKNQGSSLQSEPESGSTPKPGEIWKIRRSEEDSTNPSRKTIPE
jgi:hypothetical protein